MNANVNKTNGVKLLAAVMALAMVVIGMAVVISDDNGINAAEPEGITFDVSGDIVSLGNQSNDSLGNTGMTFKKDANGYTVTGILKPITDSSIITAIQAPAGYNYAFVYKIAGYEDNFLSREGFSNWRSETSTDGSSEMMHYINDDNLNGSITYYISDEKLENKVAAEAEVAAGNATSFTISWNFTLVDTVVDNVDGVLDAFEENDIVSYTPETNDVISMPDVEGKTLVIGDLTTQTSFTIKYVDDEGKEVTSTAFNIKGTGIAIQHGSIIVDGDTLSGTITVPNGETIYISAASVGDSEESLEIILGEGSQAVIDADMSITGTSNVIFSVSEDVKSASVLVQDGAKITMEPESKVVINDNVRMNNYGSITGGTVVVNNGATFYSATPIDTNFYGEGTIDLTDAMETLKISDKLASSAVLKPTQNVLVNGNLTINAGEYLVITGSLQVQEGVTVTINEGGLLMVYGPSASADIQGTIISKGAFSGNVPDVAVATGAAGFTYYDGKSIEISGTVNAKKATADDVRTVWINGDSEISGTVTIDSKAKAQFGGETKIVAGGVLNINGTYAGTILNQGTVNLNGYVDSGATVSMNSVDAVLNVTSLKGANVLIINDSGLYLQTKDNGKRVSVGDSDTITNSFTIKNVKGITVTEGYTYTTDENGDRIVHNNLYIDGTLSAQDSKNDNYGVMTIIGGTVSVSGELTIAKVDVIFNNGNMDVTGNMYINDDDRKFGGTGEITVTGLVRSIIEIDGNTLKVNAVKYEQTIENIPYYFYTNLAAAIESGEENLTVLGDLWILEDTTIPNGITVDASTPGTTVYVGDDSRDITDITLTIANGGLLMAETIEVDATMMIENTDTGIDCRTIISDVSSTTETTAKYTNIYTALSQAQSGETVTITKKAGADGKAVVSIIRDVEIKDGVTLVIPAINTLQISEGVTLTNNGILDVRGTIIVADGKDANTEAKFGTVTEDKNGNQYAVIANNGTVVSVAKMTYADYSIAGAYYTINGKFYITPVEDAVAQIGNTETDSITIYGKNTVGTAAFAGTVEEPVKVVLDATAKITADFMTVTNGAIIANAGAKLNGTYGGSTGTVVLSNMYVPEDKTFTIEDKAVTVSEQTSQVTYMVGELANVTDAEDKLVNSVEFNGAVTVSGMLKVTFTPSKNDFVAIGENSTVNVIGKDAEIETSMITVYGILVADNEGTIDIDTVNVLGTLDVKAKTDKTNAGKTEITTIMVGAASFSYGSDVAAALNGTFNANNVYVFSKAILDSAASETLNANAVKSTEFYVEDTLWMTAYVLDGTVPITDTKGEAQIVPIDLLNSKFSAWQYKNAEGILTNVLANKNVGDYDKVYAGINYDIYEVTVFADPGIDAVYIDGKLMTKGYYVAETGQMVEGFKLWVAAGEHEITYKLGNYYSGDADMTVNGTQISGNKFTTSGTDPEDTQVTIYLQGIEASAPETPSGSSDDGMGLTDYLLIVLVVLIVIMAIMVAMRLMRS